MLTDLLLVVLTAVAEMVTSNYGHQMDVVYVSEQSKEVRVVVTSSIKASRTTTDWGFGGSKVAGLTGIM